jgi:hypothetical protein
MESHCSTYDDAKDFFPRLRRWYEEIKLFPTPNQVNFLFEDRFDGLKEAIRSFGWPPAQGDESGWRHEECLKEVERTAYDYAG